MKFSIIFLYIKLQIRNTINIGNIMQKMEGIEFYLALIEEDKQTGFKKGYKAMVSRHHIDSNGQRDVEYYGAPVHT